MDFQVHAMEPLQVSPVVRFKDGILCRSPWLEATLYPLVLSEGRHSSLPCSCTLPFAVLAVLLGAAFLTISGSFESTRRDQFSDLRHTFMYCDTWLGVTGPVGLRVRQLLHFLTYTWIFWKLDDYFQWMTSLHNLASPALVFWSHTLECGILVMLWTKT